MWEHAINPIFVSFGFVITYLFLRSTVEKKVFNLKLDDVDTVFVYLIVGTILSARVFEILFYKSTKSMEEL